MPLAKQTLDIPIVGGHDEKTDSHLAVALRSLTNMRYRKTGAIESRYGSTVVLNGTSAGTDVPMRSGVTAATVNTPDSVHAYGSTLVLCGGGKIYTAPASTSSQRWAYADRITDVVVERDVVTDMTPYVTSGDVAIDSTGTYLCYAWIVEATGVTSRAVWASIVRADTGAVIAAPANLGTPTSAVKVTFLTDGSNTINPCVVWSDNAGNIQAATATVTTTTKVTWNAAVNIITDQTGAVFDIATIDSGYLAVLYERNTPKITLRTFSNAAGVLTLSQTTAVAAADAAPAAIALSYSSGNRLWYGWTYTTGGTSYVRGGAFNTSGSTESLTTVSVYSRVTANAHIQLGICSLSSTQALYVAGGGDVVTSYYGMVTNTLTSSGTAGTAEVLFDPYPCSRPWVYGGRAFVLAQTPRYSDWVTGTSTAGSPSRLDGLYYDTVVLEIAHGTQKPWPVALTAPRLSMWGRWNSGVASVVATATGEYLTVFHHASDTDSQRTALGKARISFNEAKKRQAVEVNGTLYLTGGILQCFDGSVCTEPGFIGKPRIDAYSSPAGGVATGGNYTGYVTWEWTDNAGNLHRSEPSAVSPTNALAANDYFRTVNLQCHLTSKVDAENGGAPNISHVLWMTAAGGSTYYRANAGKGVVGASVPTPNDFTLGPTGNNDTGPADADLTRQEILYTTAANVPVVPPSCKLIAHHKGRLWIDSDTGALWVTPIVTEGLIAQFHDAYVIPPFEGGRPTALASLDDALIVFKRDSIYAIYGDGPTSSGSAGTDTSDPKRVTGDIGCIEPRSVVAIPGGLMFQSRSGIYLLTRGLEVVPVGKRVEDTLVSYPTVSSAVVVPAQNEVIFTLLNTLESYSVRVVYDYLNDVWAVDTVYDPILADSAAIRGAAYINGVYWFVTTGKSVYYQDTTVYTDGLTWVTHSFATGRIHLAGMAGFQRVYRLGLLGKYGTDCNISVSVGYDYQAFESAGTFAAGTFSSPTVNAQFHLAKQKCEAVTFAYSDSSPGAGSIGTGKGFTITGLTLEVGTKGKAARNLPATRRA